MRICRIVSNILFLCDMFTMFCALQGILKKLKYYNIYIQYEYIICIDSDNQSF